METTNRAIDSITVAASGIVQIRYAVDNGNSVEFERRCIVPTDDTANEPRDVQDICAAAFTEEVINQYLYNMNTNAI